MRVLWYVVVTTLIIYFNYGASNTNIKVSLSKIKSFLPKQCEGIQDVYCREMLSKIEIENINVPDYISSTKVGCTFVKYSNFADQFPWQKYLPNRRKNKPIVLLHGFDSSLLEFRKLGSFLSEKNDVYIPDMLGWGFGNYSNVMDFTPKAKLDYIRSFIRNVVKDKCILVGASLGGAVSIILAAESPELIDKLVLIDAQGFVDGSDSSTSDLAAKFGVSVLKSQPLRYFANLISYSDKGFATWEAMQIGRLHCFTDTWEKASIDFVQSGGFKVSSYVNKVKQNTLVLWGREDKVIDVSNAYKFQEILPKNQVVILDKCGHVPHIEKPLETAEYILEFIKVN